MAEELKRHPVAAAGKLANRGLRAFENRLPCARVITFVQLIGRCSDKRRGVQEPDTQCCLRLRLQRCSHFLSQGSLSSALLHFVAIYAYDDK